eukprot:gene9975-10998_t
MNFSLFALGVLTYNVSAVISRTSATKRRPVARFVAKYTVKPMHCSAEIRRRFQMTNKGKHRCPHNATGGSRVINKTNFDNCKVSEYGDGFKQTQPKRGPFHRQKDLLIPKGDVEYKTVNNDDFIAHDLEPRKIKEPEKYMPPTGKMDVASEYVSHYNGEIAEPAKMEPYLKTVTQAVPTGKMQQETSNKMDFKRFSTTTRQQPILRDKTYSPPKSPFTSTSIHRADFQRFNDPPRPSARQPDKISTKGQSIILSTSYNDEFKRHSFSNTSNIVKKRGDYRPPSKPFDGNSLMQSDYTSHLTAKKADIHKPIATVFKSDRPMERETTNLEDFKSWPVKMKEPRKKEEYKKPDGEIALKPTSSDYKYFGSAAIPAKSARPKTKLRTGRDGMFDGTSNYSTDFQVWGSVPVLPVKLKDELTRLSGEVKSDLRNTSEHKEMYKRHNTAPARIFKPKATVFQTTDAMLNKTMYSIEFGAKPVVACAGERLLKNPSGIQFEDDWDTGHRFVIDRQPLPSIDNQKSMPDNKIEIWTFVKPRDKLGDEKANVTRLLFALPMDDACADEKMSPESKGRCDRRPRSLPGSTRMPRTVQGVQMELY